MASEQGCLRKFYSLVSYYYCCHQLNPSANFPYPLAHHCLVGLTFFLDVIYCFSSTLIFFSYRNLKLLFRCPLAINCQYYLRLPIFYRSNLTESTHIRNETFIPEDTFIYQSSCPYLTPNFANFSCPISFELQTISNNNDHKVIFSH